MENMMTGVASLIVAAVCVLGVFSDFKDTTVQRGALGLGCVASSGVAWHCYKGGELPGAVDVLLWCLALHCLEAARKFWRDKAKPKLENAKSDDSRNEKWNEAN